MSRTTGTVPAPFPTTLQTSTNPTLSTAPGTPATTSTSTKPPSAPPNDFDFYYYILIIVGLLLVLLFAYAFNRRKRHRKALARQNRHSALSQDLDGYGPRRAWLQGAYWNRNQGIQMRREDGLDESGEAPPPYARSGDELPSVHQMPLRAITKPPDYQDTYRAVAVDTEDRTRRSCTNADSGENGGLGHGVPAQQEISDDSGRHETLEAPPAILR